MGPLIDDAAVEKVEELVTDAVEPRRTRAHRREAQGSTSGFYYAPTVLTDVPADARVNHEEIFGPRRPDHRDGPRRMP